MSIGFTPPYYELIESWKAAIQDGILRAVTGYLHILKDEMRKPYENSAKVLSNGRMVIRSLYFIEELL